MPVACRYRGIERTRQRKIGIGLHCATIRRYRDGTSGRDGSGVPEGTAIDGETSCSIAEIAIASHLQCTSRYGRTA
ncbi:hypothetical protein SDC9_209207 [bioreactor metagenome]|uniref:Uncharacterized protein n=1 Tax=bioreactor metagenome TaxID=1076179 RepID=A0A645JEE5_9ZZZZ